MRDGRLDVVRGVADYDGAAGHRTAVLLPSRADGGGDQVGSGGRSGRRSRRLRDQAMIEAESPYLELGDRAHITRDDGLHNRQLTEGAQRLLGAGQEQRRGAGPRKMARKTSTMTSRKAVTFASACGSRCSFSSSSVMAWSVRPWTSGITRGAAPWTRRNAVRYVVHQAAEGQQSLIDVPEDEPAAGPRVRHISIGARQHRVGASLGRLSLPHIVP